MNNKDQTKKLACPYFLMNACKYGANCFRSHDRSAELDDICRFYQKGQCSYGKKCRYRHVKPDKNRNSLKEDETLRLPGLKPYSRVVRIDETNSNSSSTTTSTVAQAKTILPICPYKAKSGICPNERDCPYVHGLECEYCGGFCIHPTDRVQRSRHIKQCVDDHEKRMNEAFAFQVSSDKTCGICLEFVVNTKCARFGIMPNCDHVYCLECIRQWRTKNGGEFDNRLVKSCPECRITSDFVVPSKVWFGGKQEKLEIIQAYKDRLAETECAYFQRGNGYCPFADHCFYKHELPDGTRAKLGEPSRLFDSEGKIRHLEQITFGALFEGFAGDQIAGQIEDPETFLEILRERYVLSRAYED